MKNRLLELPWWVIGPLLFIGVLAALPNDAIRRAPHEYINVQTCVFTEEEFGSKLANLCSRLDPYTNWAFRQRI
jgi:hypothetical protein